MLEIVLEKLWGLIEPIVGMRKEKRELADNVLRSISHALNETYLYYRSIDDGADRNREIEAQLCRYWSAAAIPLRHIDRELASLCEHKAEYWLNPDHWNKDRIRDAGIGLSEVRDLYRAKLGFKARPGPRRVAPKLQR